MIIWLYPQTLHCSVNIATFFIGFFGDLCIHMKNSPTLTPAARASWISALSALLINLASCAAVSGFVIVKAEISTCRWRYCVRGRDRSGPDSESS